jgi:nucleoid DNA-binding protein
LKTFEIKRHYSTELAISEIKKAGSFTLPGVGKLVLLKPTSHTNRNPSTWAEIKIPAKRVGEKGG